jgi:hypothetical protein
VLQGSGVVLERSKAIGHSRIAGIAGFGKQAEIRQPQISYQSGPLQDFWSGRVLAETGMQQYDHNKHNVCCCESDEKNGFAHQAVTMKNFIPKISGLPV